MCACVCTCVCFILCGKHWVKVLESVCVCCHMSTCRCIPQPVVDSPQCVLWGPLSPSGATHRGINTDDWHREHLKNKLLLLHCLCHETETVMNYVLSVWCAVNSCVHSLFAPQRWQSCIWATNHNHRQICSRQICSRQICLLLSARNGIMASSHAYIHGC